MCFLIQTMGSSCLLVVQGSHNQYQHSRPRRKFCEGHTDQQCCGACSSSPRWPRPRPSPSPRLAPALPACLRGDRLRLMGETRSGARPEHATWPPFSRAPAEARKGDVEMPGEPRGRLWPPSGRAAASVPAALRPPAHPPDAPKWVGSDHIYDSI
jgi:hypothetical protein